jgi:hypothetical protein
MSNKKKDMIVKTKKKKNNKIRKLRSVLLLTRSVILRKA